VGDSPKAPKISFSQKQNEYDEIKLHEFLSCVRKLKLCIDFSFHIFAFKWFQFLLTCRTSFISIFDGFRWFLFGFMGVFI